MLRLSHVAAAAASIVFAPRLSAQTPSPPAADSADTTAHRAPFLTLQTWADEAWLRLTDRGGSAGGRASRAGILQRFQRRMDAQYDVNLLTSRYAPDEDAEWHARSSGFRLFGGSFDRAQMAEAFDVKGEARIARRWAIGVRVQSEHDLEGKHDVVRIRLRRDLPRGFAAYAESGVQALKSDMDGTAGVEWRRAGARARVDVTVLDYANNLINHNEVLLRDIYYDTTYRYARQPVALRTTLRVPLGRAWAELQSANVGPGRVTIDPLHDSTRVAQGERAGYASALVGWALGRSAQVAGFATRLRARTDRAPLTSASPALDDFVLVEATRQVGATATAAPRPWAHLSAVVARTVRTETRDYRPKDTVDVDYADRAVDARLVSRFGRLGGGVQAVADAGLDDRRTLRGRGTVPGRQPVDRYSLARVALMVGWRSRNGTEFLLGTRLEHDIDTPGGTLQRTLSVAGFQGRGSVVW